MGLFNLGSNTNTSNVVYSPTTESVNVTPSSYVGPTTSTTSITANLKKTSNLLDSFNAQLNQPVLVAGSGSSSLLKGLPLNLNDFFSSANPTTTGANLAQSSTSGSGTSSSTTWIVLGIIGFALLIFFLKRHRG